MESTNTIIPNTNNIKHKGARLTMMEINNDNDGGAQAKRVVYVAIRGVQQTINATHIWRCRQKKGGVCE